MRRSFLAALAAAAALAGCPLPQPLPDYPAGTITPPRILPEATSALPASSVDSIIPVPAGCAVEPAYTLDARIFYQDSVTVEAHWFVDYRTDVASRYAPQNNQRQVPPDPDPLVLERQVPTYIFHPYRFPPPAELGGFPGPSAPGVVHVVELVVSNGFDPSPTAPEPNRTPAVTDGDARFEIQTYRWVFVNVAGPPCPEPL